MKINKSTGLGKFGDIADIKRVIKDIMMEVVDAEFEDNRPLLMTHCIDSMDVVEIATAIEERFGIKIYGEEVTFENFDTVSRISSFIQQKLSEKGSER